MSSNTGQILMAATVRVVFMDRALVTAFMLGGDPEQSILRFNTIQHHQ
jgi:hypothetical protein